MNKIVVYKDYILINDGDKIFSNKITIDKDLEYIVEYASFDIDIEFNIIDGCRAKLFFIFNMDEYLSVNSRFNVLDGELDVYKFYCAKNVFEKVDINLDKDNSVIRYNFSNVCRYEEEYLINIYHNEKNTYSYINNKGISFDNSSLNYIINSYVPKGKIGSFVSQSTRIVTLGCGFNSISPNMYIDEEDVSAKHSSIIGGIDNDILFYLMSRGISYDDGMMLLIKGYLFGDNFINYDLRNEIVDIIYRFWR